MKKYHQHRQKEYRLLLWCGNANNGANCGLVYSNSNNAWTNAWTNIGSRHTIQGNARRLYVLSATPEPCIRILPHSGCHEQTVFTEHALHHYDMDMDNTFALEVNGREVNDKGCFVDTGEMVKI